MTTVWLRDEDKEFEKRTPLTPKNAKKLIDAGITVIVEESQDRIFPISHYSELGCKIVPSHSWKTDAPVSDDTFILGLKELKVDNFPIKRNHIYFAHIYKGQDGAKQVFDRYSNGGGTLFDLEFLLNEEGRRIAAFGYWAGYVGAALAVENYYDRGAVLKHYKNKQEWLKLIKSKMTDKKPSTLIIGALGRCGSGARELLTDLSLDSTNWDVEETKPGGPFSKITQHNIFINSVLMTFKIPPFLNDELMSSNTNLKVICDVSCDPNSNLNPIPIYSKHTSWDKPLTNVSSSKAQCDVIAIDNLPSALPMESSEDYSDQLTPHLLNLVRAKENYVWKNAKEIFNTKRKGL